MLDCSTEIIAHEEMNEKCDPDKICNIVFERLELKKKRKKRYIAFVAIASILCGCVGGGIVLAPGGKVTDQSVFVTEDGLIKKKTGKESQMSIKSDFIEDKFLYDSYGNPIAKHIIEVDTDFKEDKEEELYIENGTMLILHNNRKGIETNKDKNRVLRLTLEQKNTNGDPGTVEVGYLCDGRPYCVEVSSRYVSEVMIKGEEGKEYYPYIKNTSSDRIIIKIRCERE